MAAYNSKLIQATFPSPNVLLLSLNRPPVNAFNYALWAELPEHFNRASVDPDVRCVVIASALDKGFTAGLDLTDSSLGTTGDDPARTALLLRAHIDDLQNSISSIQNCEKPVIAAVHGICFGAGMDLISAADIRFCSSDKTVFSIKEVDVGLAADVGSLQRLPRTTGNASLLYELALTARNFGPAEAVQLGLVSRVVHGGKEDVLNEALKVAETIAAKSPVAILGTKHLLNYSREHTVREGLEYTKVWNMAMLQASDLPAAFEAFSTKRPPTFAKLSKL
ncbi:hypothetical protein JCM1841_002413 [Sporobolomyces salmonicolor]